MLADLVPAGIGIADHDRECGIGRGADIHQLLRAIDGDCGTARRVGNDGAGDRALRTEHNIDGLELCRLRVGDLRCQHGGQQQCRDC